MCNFIICIFFLLIRSSFQSHFRGGSISWKHVNATNTNNQTRVEVAINTRFFWDYNVYRSLCSSSSHYGILFGGKTLILPINDNWSINSQVNCYEFSILDAWSAGNRTQYVNIATSVQVKARFSSCCWISGIKSVSNSLSWFMDFTIDLKTRLDKNHINSSPTTSIVPYIKISKSQEEIIIPVNDPDGDVVRCRCAIDTCLEGLSIDVNSCVITFRPVSKGYYSIEITIEDYEKAGSNVPLSSVPLQFIANVLDGFNLSRKKNSNF